MADKPQSKDPAGGKTRASVERAMALRDVMSHAVEVEKEVRKASGPRGESHVLKNFMMTLSVVLMAFTAFAYLSKPEFIFGANPKNVPEVRRDANVRMTLYLLSRSVETFKRTDPSHKYPDNLAVIKSAPKSVTYSKLTEDVFELRAKEGDKEIVFRSTDPVDPFLGRAPKVLSGRGQ